MAVALVFCGTLHSPPVEGVVIVLARCQQTGRANRRNPPEGVVIVLARCQQTGGANRRNKPGEYTGESGFVADSPVGRHPAASVEPPRPFGPPLQGRGMVVTLVFCGTLHSPPVEGWRIAPGWFH